MGFATREGLLAALVLLVLLFVLLAGLIRLLPPSPVHQLEQTGGVPDRR